MDRCDYRSTTRRTSVRSSRTQHWALCFVPLLPLAFVPLVAGCGGSSSSSSPDTSLLQGREAQAVAYRMNIAHTGRVRFGRALKFPSSPTWSVKLDYNVSPIDETDRLSYPLVVNGRVYVTAGKNGAYLYALDLATGHTVWGPTDLGGTYEAGGLCYDNGKVFVVNHNGLLRSFDAATGTPGWSAQLPGQLTFPAGGPTASNGTVYIAAPLDEKLCAFDEATGSLLWAQTVEYASSSSATLSPSGDSIFLSYTCHTYKFDAKTGAPLWQNDRAGGGVCGGGFGGTAAYVNGQLYSPYVSGNRTVTIFDAGTGSFVGAVNGENSPAFDDTQGYFVSGGALHAIDQASHQVRWRFDGGGQVISEPIVIDSTVIVSGSGKLYALDAATGSPVWNTTFSALNPSAGEGYLLAPGDMTLTAWRIIP